MKFLDILTLKRRRCDHTYVYLNKESVGASYGCDVLFHDEYYVKCLECGREVRCFSAEQVLRLVTKLDKKVITQTKQNAKGDEKMTKTDFKKYTKDELIYYLESIQIYIPKRETTSIKYSILNKRYEDISNEINVTLEDTTRAIKRFNEKKTIEHMIAVKELNDKYIRLSNKQRKIEKELRGVF